MQEGWRLVLPAWVAPPGEAQLRKIQQLTCTSAANHCMLLAERAAPRGGVLQHVRSAPTAVPPGCRAALPRCRCCRCDFTVACTSGSLHSSTWQAARRSSSSRQRTAAGLPPAPPSRSRLSTPLCRAGTAQNQCAVAMGGSPPRARWHAWGPHGRSCPACLRLVTCGRWNSSGPRPRLLPSATASSLPGRVVPAAASSAPTTPPELSQHSCSAARRGGDAMGGGGRRRRPGGTASGRQPRPASPPPWCRLPRAAAAGSEPHR